MKAFGEEAENPEAPRGARSDTQESQLSEKTDRLVPSNERHGRKIRATFHLSTELLNELRDIVVALSGPPDRLTLSDLAESALRREIDRLKRLHTRGKNFAKRAQELRGGRPIR